MRGASALALLDTTLKSSREQLKNAIVADIGGTSTDVGQLVNAFPRQAANRVQVMWKLSEEVFRFGKYLNILGWRCLHQFSDAGSV
jgi:N-methylhydantoinase A/oxoprolinase/acetone carboxylase beta subunit